MLTCDFEPAICKPSEDGTPAKYTGKIRLKPLAYEERLELIENQQTMANESGEDSEKKTIGYMQFARMFAKEKLPEYFVSSTLVRLEDGYAFDCLEKIKMDGPVSLIIPEITSALISGQLSLGK